MARVKGEIPYDVRRKKFKYNRDVSDGETLGSALIGGGASSREKEGKFTRYTLGLMGNI